MNIVKIEKERLTRFAQIVVMLNPPNIDRLYNVPYHDVLKLDCQRGYIKYLTYITVDNVVTVTSDYILEIIY